MKNKKSPSTSLTYLLSSTPTLVSKCLSTIASMAGPPWNGQTHRIAAPLRKLCALPLPFRRKPELPGLLTSAQPHRAPHPGPLSSLAPPPAQILSILQGLIQTLPHPRSLRGASNSLKHELSCPLHHLQKGTSNCFTAQPRSQHRATGRK